MTTGDRSARAQAATTFDRPVTVEAGAGTGKTTLLIHRLLVWALDIGWEHTAASLPESAGSRDSDARSERIASRLLDRVVAITFTEAAAAELADRFVAAVAAAGRGELPVGFEREWLTVDDQTLSERAHWLLPQVDRAHMTTIHAWCYELLRRHPHEAGLHPEVEVVADAQEIESVAREVVEDHYRRAYRRGYDSDLVLLGEEKLGPRDWVEIARQWVVAGWDVGTHLPEDDGMVAALASIRTFAGKVVDAAPTALADLGGNNLGPKVLAACRSTAETGDDHAQALARLVDLWPDNLRRHLAKWAVNNFNKTETGALGDLGPAVAEAAEDLSAYLSILKRLDPTRWRRRQRTVKALIEDTEAALHDHSTITFGGLLREAARLLTGNEDVAASERARIDLLLVDEFQDTDALQAKLVEALALTDEEPPPSAPSLILVGDPKQSIYGWRNADLETYERMRGEVIDRGGLELILSRNFRSTTTVLTTTDGIVGSQMRHDAGFQPHYHGLEAGADHADDHPVPVEIRRVSAESAADQARREAEWVAGDLAERRRNGEFNWHQAAILMRSKTHVRAVLRALRAAGIPYEMSADVGFHERSEVIDGAAWVRVVADPEDQVALLKVLRSPTVGLPDAALPAAWRPLFGLIRTFRRPDRETEKEIRDILKASLDGVSDVPGIERIDGWVEHAAASLGAIGRLRRDLRRLPFADFIDNLRALTDIEATEARRPEGGTRVANLEKLFDQLVERVEETGGDTHAVLRVLRRGIFFELPAEEAVPLKPIDGAVQVASIHAAKGLEFDHLYLVHFGLGGGRDGTDLQVETAVPGATMIKGVAHPQWALGQRRKKRVEEAEALRLLYVALTRARRRVVLCLPEGPCRAGTLGKLVDDGLAAAGADIQTALFQEGVDSRKPPVVDGPSLDPESLPNPPWTAIPNPPPLHDSPTRPQAEQGFTLGTPATRGGRDRGSVLHDLLAEVDLNATKPDLPERFTSVVSAEEFWTGFPSTQLGKRLLSLGDRMRGREVEVLSPADLLAHESRAAYAAGKIDLVYVDGNGDGEGGRWVVVDYKTGEPDDLAAAVSHYAPQLRYYGRALSEALSLDRPPRLELWFLDLDHIETVDP